MDDQEQALMEWIARDSGGMTVYVDSNTDEYVTSSGVVFKDQEIERIKPFMTMLDAAADENGQATIDEYGTRTRFLREDLIRYWFANPKKLLADG